MVIIPPLKQSTDFPAESLINSRYSNEAFRMVTLHFDSHSSSAHHAESMHQSYDGSLHRERKSSSSSGGAALLASFMAKITSGVTNQRTDRLYRTSTSCFAASVPKREITHWVGMDLLDFPIGSTHNDQLRTRIIRPHFPLQIPLHEIQ
jgi:hypothetical protein